jgi:UDP-glucose 4-epimerase
MPATRVLVTGGAGFVGTALIRRLVAEGGYDVVSLDDYSSGSPANHVVFHFGEFSRVVPSLERPLACLTANQLGTAKTLDFARRVGAKLVYSGSSAVFGNHMADQHLTPYAWSKAKNVELIRNYHRWYGLEYAVCYFYNVYGPGQVESGTYATVVGIFERQRRAGEPLTVVAPGTQTRAFTHVDDVVEGVLLVAREGSGDGYFLGTQEAVPIAELARLFGGPMRLVPERPGERTHSAVREGRARAELGWAPRRSLAEYVRGVVAGTGSSQGGRNEAGEKT